MYSAPLRTVLFSGQTFDLYVDSVNGNDANDGRRPNAAKRTIAGLGTLWSGVRIALAGGSQFRERLDLPVNGKVAKYGSGADPILDASDIAPSGSWSKTGGQTNVYEISWTHSIVDAQSKHSLWINAVRMVRATSVANCDATPGSFYAAAPSAGSPTTVYVHPTGSTNPTSDGKVYEITRREYGLWLNNGGRASDIYCRYGAHTWGNLIAQDDCILTRCTGKDGWRHNIFIAHNSQAIDCVAEDIEGGTVSGDNSHFIAFRSAANLSASFTRCIARGTNAMGLTAVAGFYAHTGSGTAATINYYQCSAKQCQQAFGSSATATNVIGCTITDCTFGVAVAAGYNVYGCFINGKSGALGIRMTRALSGVTIAGTVNVKGNVIIGTKGISDGGLIWNSAGNGATWNVDQNTICLVDRQSYTTGFSPFNGTSVTVNLTRNIFYTLDKAMHCGNTVTLSSDNNVFSPATMDARNNGTDYTTIAAYQSASGLDAGSSTSDPLFVNSDPLTWASIADAAVQGGSPAVSRQAGATYYQ